MSVEVRLRKTDFTSLASNTLVLQRLHGSTPRAYWLKRALVAAGWTVYYSSDGVTTSASDLWTASNFQAVMYTYYNQGASTTATVDGIWCCLRSPAVDANGDYLHICLSPRGGSQWYNPAVRGTTAVNTNMVYTKIGAGTGFRYYNGYNFGYLCIGMTLSTSTTAFSGGAPYVATNTTTSLGTLPSATGAVWSTHNMGTDSTAGSSYTTMTVVTEDSQFHVIQDLGTNATRLWFSMCKLDNGGFAIVEPAMPCDSLGTGYTTGLLGGRSDTVSATSLLTTALDYATELGGWRSAYVKRAVDNSIWSGGLSKPEPPGWEAVADSPYFDSGITVPTLVKLQAHSCSNSAHFDLGTVSDFILLGSRGLADLDMVSDTAQNKIWFVYKATSALLLKWSLTDVPSARTVVTPA